MSHAIVRNILIFHYWVFWQCCVCQGCSGEDWIRDLKCFHSVVHSQHKWNYKTCNQRLQEFPLFLHTFLQYHIHLHLVRTFLSRMAYKTSRQLDNETQNRICTFSENKLVKCIISYQSGVTKLTAYLSFQGNESECSVSLKFV